MFGSDKEFGGGKGRFPKDVYRLIRERNLDGASALLEMRSHRFGRCFDYYKCLAKMALVRENFTEASRYYGKSVEKCRSASKKFQVYGDLIRSLFLAGRVTEASEVLDSALDEYGRLSNRRFFRAQSLVDLSKFLLHLGIAEEYMRVLMDCQCVNPWHPTLRAVRRELEFRKEAFRETCRLQESVGYTMESLRSEGASGRDAMANVIVYWPMKYLSLLLRRFEGIERLYREILGYLKEKGICFGLRPQLGLNRPPDSGGRKVLSWHTIGDNPQMRHLKESPFPGFFYFDRFGYSGWSGLAKMPHWEIDRKVAGIGKEEAEAYFGGLVERFAVARKSKYPQREVDGLALPDRFIFVPLQLVDDYVAKLTDWDMFQLLDHLRGLLRGYETQIVVKRHPKCEHHKVDRFLWELGDDAQVSVVDGPISELIEKSSAVCTVNSGVGAEALLWMKPVFTASPTDYRYLAYDVREIASGAELMKLVERGVEPARYRKFLTYYGRDYLLDSGDAGAIRSRMDLFLGE